MATRIRDHVQMPQAVDSSAAETAIFNLGPMDGQKQLFDRATDELSVVMSDGQQHRYLRTNEVRPLSEGGLAVIFNWAGRYYGPK
jgi:hypothetical protein